MSVTKTVQGSTRKTGVYWACNKLTSGSILGGALVGNEQLTMKRRRKTPANKLTSRSILKVGQKLPYENIIPNNWFRGIGVLQRTDLCRRVFDGCRCCPCGEWSLQASTGRPSVRASFPRAKARRQKRHHQRERCASHWWRFRSASCRRPFRI